MSSVILKVENQQTISNMNIVMSANQITVARAKNQVAKLKDKIDNAIRNVYGNNIIGASPAQVLKLRRCFILLFLLKIKQSYVKKNFYFERNSF